MKRLPVLIFALCLFAGVANAADVYYSQSGAGAVSGANCSNAYALTRFNSATDWVADNTLHLCGTFTGAAGVDSFLQAQASGTSGHPITVKWETGAIVQAPYFSPAHGGIDLNGQSYITIDGGTNGVIRNTANGTGLTYQQDSRLVKCSNTCTGIVITNLEIGPTYLHTANLADSFPDGYGVHIQNSNAVVIGPNNNIHDANLCIFGAYGASNSGFEIKSNTITACNQSIEIGNNGASTSLAGLSIHDNDISGWVNWDDTANTNHHNCFHIFSINASSPITSPRIYNNYCHGDVGIHATSMLFLESNGGGAMTDVAVFNNVFSSTNAAHNPGNGLIYAQNVAAIYNNYFKTATGVADSIGVDFQTPASGSILKNNVFDTVWVPVYLEGGTLTATNNDYSTVSSWDYHGTFEASLAAWQAACSCDVTGTITSAPNVSAGYQPQTGSPLIGAGANLTSLGITALNSDKAGVARPAVAAWDAGAYNAGTVAPTCTLTASPAVIKLGTASTLTFTPANAPTTCTIDNGVGAVSCLGATPSVSPTALTTYTATVTNTGGTNTCTATVTIGGVSMNANVKLGANTVMQ